MLIMYDIVTFGSATVDVFASSSSQLIRICNGSECNELLAFKLGTKLLIDDLRYTVGGGGTNTAAAFSSLGLKTAFVGKIGNSFNAERILTELKRFRIDTRYVKKARGPSGFSIILDSHQKDRVILAHKGVNDTLSPKDVPLKDLKTKWIYSSSLIGTSFDTLKKVTRYAKKNNIDIAFNPSTYMVERGASCLKPVLSDTTVLIFNREEAGLLTQEIDIHKAFQKIHSMGPRIAVITDGKEGVYASDKKKVYYMRSKKVKVVDTTGAGDAFAASFITGLIKQKDITFCLKLGIINAVSIIQKYGAKDHLLSWQEALNQLKDFKTKAKITAL